MPHKLGLVFVVVLSVMATTMPSVNADCWWTGCQPETWAVVGCDHYNRKETGRKPCTVGGVNGNKYNCCSKDGGGGDEGGDEEGEEDFKFMENPPAPEAMNQDVEDKNGWGWPKKTEDTWSENMEEDPPRMFLSYN